MTYVLVRHKVKNYDLWKPEYDGHADARREATSQGGQVFKNLDDTNELVLLFEFADLAKAREFTQSEDLKKRMMKAGVADQPDIYFLDRIETSSS